MDPVLGRVESTQLFQEFLRITGVEKAEHKETLEAAAEIQTVVSAHSLFHSNLRSSGTCRGKCFITQAMTQQLCLCNNIVEKFKYLPAGSL